MTDLCLEEQIMSSRLGPIDITCDAPPYTVVQACETLEFRTPLDVRWCRISHFLSGQGGEASLHPWKWFFGKNESREKTCSCGEPLPNLEWYTFMFISGKVSHYHLGQCRRCRSIFWEEG